MKKVKMMIWAMGILLSTVLAVGSVQAEQQQWSYTSCVQTGSNTELCTEYRWDVIGFDSAGNVIFGFLPVRTFIRHNGPGNQYRPPHTLEP